MPIFEVILLFVSTNIFILTVLSSAIKEGLFFDGATYSAIANNLANGVGSFFNLHYTDSIYSSFYEHPPLYFGIQAFIYKLFGNSIYVEKFYNVFLLLTIFLALYLFSKPKKTLLPICLFLSIPLVTWSFSNNLLENTMMVFTTFAVYFFYIFSLNRKIMFFILGCLLTFCAFMTKGFVGLFPLASLAIYDLVFTKKISFKTILFSFAVFIILCTLIAFLFINNDFKIYAYKYIQIQLLPSLSGQREFSGHFVIFKRFLQNIAPPAFIILLIKVIVDRNLNFKFSKNSLFYLLTAISASLPLALSPKQSGFYLVPSFIFFVLFLSEIFFYSINNSVNKLIYLKRRLVAITMTITLASLICIIYFKGHYYRDEELITDIKAINKTLNNSKTITICNDLYGDWALYAYFQRYFQVSLISENIQSTSDSNAKILCNKQITNKKLIHSFQSYAIYLNN